MFQIGNIDKNRNAHAAHTRTAVRAVIFCGEKLLLVKTNCGDYKFPGGGVRKGEGREAALLREIREETGYTDVTVGPCVGTAVEFREDSSGDGTFFQMDSYYHVCRMESSASGRQALDAYEAGMEFQAVWVDVKEAAESNRKLLNAAMCDKKRELLAEIPWLERETQALERIAGSPLCRLALEVWECGAILRTADRGQAAVGEKAGHANFVTAYDKQVQRELRRRLTAAVPDAAFVGEEEDAHASIAHGPAFIVDPIDGTTNFIKDYHCSCISVGMTVDGAPQLGIVYNPYLDELFTAERGQGAYCNGRRIHVSEEPFANGLVLFGTSPYYEELAGKSFQMAYDYFSKALDIRRSGSAALDLCSIASGRAELYFELRLSPWDYAAGALIVEEAGGSVTTVEGGPIAFDRPCSIKATNGKIS